MLTDPLSDMIAQIKNAQAVKKETVSIPYSRLKWAILEILEKNNYIGEINKLQKKGGKIIKIKLNYEQKNLEKIPKIKEINRISKPSQRVYVEAQEIFPFKKGKGIRILSTSKGLMTDKEAKEMNIGGEVLLEVW
ncbi:MAG TPA: 30S ribosomal protein S8 [Candidatus Paceibacterota bacterium]|jgi:small subunit ribosomal protein S8|nr:30S ribosomal protein S8 [Candidatus Paceibacterota bacterium]HOQ15415.1 30S ribosomal protein S8 [Candidatus Paceibacterota bacterium]HPQ22815.1 30S ribosomal protein S8 [Candidatus Paceibacterota bacterium]HRR45562.1 30S ribosomal protein S8 [Candidatus Paceibacterota bacterium]